MIKQTPSRRKMKNKNPQKLWIVIFTALLLAIVILILGNRSFKATEQAAFDEFNQRQLVLAKGATSGMELYFESLAVDMRAIGETPEVQQFDETLTPWELRHRFNELKPLGVNDVGILDADGVLRYTASTHQSEGVDFSQQKYYQEAKRMTGNDTYIVEFVESGDTETGQKDVLVAVPMFESATDENPSSVGRFVGVALCTLKLDTLTQRFVAPIQASEQGHAFLIDDEYNVLWSPDGSLLGKNLLEAGEGSPLFQQIMERMATGNSGMAEYSHYKFDDSVGEYTKDTEDKLIAYAPMHLGNELWAIGVWAPKDDARLLVRSAYRQQLLVVGLSILVVFLASAHVLAVSLRVNKFLKQEVETKSGELEESHQRLLTVLDDLDAAVYVSDMETYKILFANKHLRDSWGEVEGKTCWHVLQEGQSGPCDFCTNDKLLTPDGEPGEVCVYEFQNTVTGRWYEVHDRAIRWVDGRIARLEIAINISKRKQAEEALEGAYAFQQAIIDGVTEPIVVVGADYRVILMNRAAHELSASEPGGATPSFCYQVSHQNEMPCQEIGHPCPMEQVRQLGRPVTVVHKHYRTSGEWRYFEIIASPLWGIDGAFKGIVETIRDITDYKVVEEALEQQEKVMVHSDDELEQFAHKVVRSLQDFFTKLE